MAARKNVGAGHTVITDESGEIAAAEQHPDAEIYAEDMAPLIEETEPQANEAEAQSDETDESGGLVLTGAASFGHGGRIYRRGEVISVDDTTEAKLLATGLFAKG